MNGAAGVSYSKLNTRQVSGKDASGGCLQSSAAALCWEKHLVMVCVQELRPPLHVEKSPRLHTLIFRSPGRYANMTLR